MINKHWTRREAILAAAATGLLPSLVSGQERSMITRPIPSSGEALPVLGIGTYDVFDHASTPDAVAKSREIVDILLGEAGIGSRFSLGVLFLGQGFAGQHKIVGGELV